MNKTGQKLRVLDELVQFWCPGCDCEHSINVGNDIRPAWEWNQSVEAPTFSPSVLVTGGHYIDGHSGSCWCTYNRKRIERGEQPTRFACKRCHSFVRDGRIQFLGDCSHALAGQTVDLPNWPKRDPA